ncbi:MAG: hypothetical protein IIC74_10315, partial [Bacteroidetes bacterium]|nr:hypothetical protein [Bacteroidota bacterium]
TAQQKLKKTTQSVKANKDLTLNLNTSYTNIEIDTWNKNEVKIEAYIESKELSKEELQDALESWNVEVTGSGANISISTGSDFNPKYNWNFNFEFDDDALKALEDLQFVIADLPKMPEMPLMPNMNFVMPEMNFEMPEMPEMPELPELPEGVHNVNFDFDAYKKDGEKYLEEWSKEYEEKYGKEYKDKMKAWAKKFSKTDFDKYSKEMEAWGEKFGKSFGKEMESWGEKFEDKFGKDFELKMEAWSKKMDGKWAKDMEAWGERFGAKFEAKIQAREKVLDKRLKANEERIHSRKKALEKRSLLLKNRLENLRSDKIIKTIKIKMPRNTKLRLNVRHGELKIVSVIHNLKADLSYATFLAETIDGSNSSINASYTPVLVTNWNAGELKLNYVDNALLKNVKSLVLHSNSSNVNIDNLSGNSVIDGSFGDLTIRNILDSFNNLNLILENSDALITLPKTNFNLQYKGMRSRFQHPDKKTKENISTFSTGNLSSNKTIVINAKYSNVVMQ